MSIDDKSSKPDPKTSHQRKSTLKWGSDGELSSVDMARILDKLKNRELTECDISCDINQK